MAAHVPARPHRPFLHGVGDYRALTGPDPRNQLYPDDTYCPCGLEGPRCLAFDHGRSGSAAGSTRL
jgi:hypothetical protein